MRHLLTFATFVAVALGAFALSIAGLGAFANAVVFMLAACGLLFSTVNLTSAKRAAQLAKMQAEQQQTAALAEQAASAQ